MGISWSNTNSNSNRRRRNNYPPPFPPPYYYSSDAHPPQLPPPPPPSQPPPPQGYYFPPTNPSTTPYVGTHPLPPAPPPQTHSFYYSNGYATPTTAAATTNAPNYANRLHYHPYYANQGAPAWAPVRPPVAAAAAAAPPPYVDHQTTKKIRNDVNLHKDTLRLEIDELNPDHHLVSFVFDALFDGRFTIYYLAKEEEKCRFIPLYPDAFAPISFPFQKGVGQKFCQPPGTGIDLGFFELEDLAKPSPEEDLFPLVICAETSMRTSEDETSDGSTIDASPHMQITQAVLVKSNGIGPFEVKVIRQILWIDGVRYELRELYGIGSGSTAADFDDNDPGKECVICMTEPKDTAVLPCRHMCMCSECAKALRLQSNKCPICRQPIEELMEIKINNDDK
ncbi:hypothetical protein HN51_002757 [Arachis hypogaea]|uniref:RING-type E3 ubiquitin transferase n=1 Tax=Arachis hypogaea TaxID=3818 RepID=A0A445EL92_ARAHY|nr:probable E3 ubiquitin-protein ligase LUL4 [Arachis hypogaea]QHO50983.1 putative E3 ubiquitin-protein ligase [Arachis hypogaea]RYR76229.1 hypothetical protein Ahy_A01g000836 [Arachis hypogaea]